MAAKSTKIKTSTANDTEQNKLAEYFLHALCIQRFRRADLMIIVNMVDHVHTKVLESKNQDQI